MYKYKV